MSASTDAPLLALSGLSVARGEDMVVAPVNLAFAPGTRIALAGPNGAGKSTLLRAIAGILPSPGHVQVQAQDVRRLSLIDRAKRIAYLPQERSIAWGIPVEAIVALGRGIRAAGGRMSEADRMAIEAAIAATDLAHLRSRPANRLSHGEQARVLLARALATEAPVLLADEPVAALDPRHQHDVLDALSAYAAQGRVVITVLHDLTLAANWADEVLLMAEGRVVADGPPGEVLAPARLEAVFGIAAERLAARERYAFLFGSALQ